MNGNKVIKYIGCYDRLYDGKQTRVFSLAAAKKMDYLCNVLNRIGYKVEIISPAYIIGKNESYEKEATYKLNKNISLILTPSIGAKNKLIRIFRVLLSKIWLFVYLIKNCTANEKVLIYHDYELAFPVLMAQFIRHFKIVLEVEEQFSKVWSLTIYQKFKEDCLLKKGIKGSLVVSELLAEKLAIVSPIISYGNYSVYQGVIDRSERQDIISLIYTGSIDKVKGSAFIAMETITYLPKNYRLMISGPIVQQDKKDFEERMNEINEHCGRKAVEYLGILGGEEYQRLLLNADIALNPQKDGEFGTFLFPSKIISYMSYDLPVVSTRGESIVRSRVSDLIIFAEDFSPEKIAAAIMKVDIEVKLDCRGRLNELNVIFCRQLMTLLG